MTSLAEVTWPEVAADRAPVLVVPIGATEQHGPHLPLSTDTDIAVSLAARLAVRVPGVLVAPALPYGASGEHADFPGTLSLGAHATETVVVELCRSADLLARRVLLLNAHGGNAAPLAAPARCCALRDGTCARGHLPPQGHAVTLTPGGRRRPCSSPSGRLFGRARRRGRPSRWPGCFPRCVRMVSARSAPTAYSGTRPAPRQPRASDYWRRQPTTWSRS